MSRALAALVLALPWAFAAGQVASVERHLEVGGRDRSYLVDLPPRYAARGPLPLVLDFHGGGGSPTGARMQTGFSTLGARVGAIVVYPAGSGRFGEERLLTWNTGSCCGYAKAANIDEAAFVRALLDTLERTHPIDRSRIFATGLSNGGMMSYLVACRLADRIAVRRRDGRRAVQDRKRRARVAGRGAHVADPRRAEQRARRDADCVGFLHGAPASDSAAVDRSAAPLRARRSASPSPGIDRARWRAASGVASGTPPRTCAARRRGPRDSAPATSRRSGD